MSGEKILIVDDDVYVCNAIERALKPQGYLTQAVYSGKEAVGKALADRPDLILLDIVMPEFNGIEACKSLRQAPPTAHIPIVMLTARLEEEYISLAMQGGADDYIIKPFDAQELKDKIEDVLSRQAKGLLPSQAKNITEKPKEGK